MKQIDLTELISAAELTSAAEYDLIRFDMYVCATITLGCVLFVLLKVHVDIFASIISIKHD